MFSNTLGLGTPLTDKTPTSTSGALLDIIISSMALGYIAIFADYVTVLNPSSALRKKFRSCLGAFGVIDLETTTKQHPLATSSFGAYDTDGHANQPADSENGSKVKLANQDRNLPRPPSNRAING